MPAADRSADPKSAEPQPLRAGRSSGLLSPGERALWFLHRLAPGSAAYNLAGALRIEHLDAAALRRAVFRLVERHPALRTTFPAEHGEPFRRVREWLEPDIDEMSEEDIAGLACGELRERFEAEALRPFDPEHGPLLRVRIFRTGGRCGGGDPALFVFHHLIADFWSLTIVLRELGDLYGEETGGAPAELLPPPALYEQWVERRALELTGPRGKTLRAFWMQRLAGPVPVLNLPADRPRPAQPSGAGVSGTGRLDTGVTARLQALARSQGATLFAAILAGFQLLLHRLTGDEEIWIGVPAAGRGASRWARTVGYFVNPVVLRSRPLEAASFAALLERGRHESEEALAHRDWPFPWLAEELHPLRDAGRTPLFQAMLVLYRTRYVEEEPLALLALGQGGGAARLGGLELETLPLGRRGAQIDISLTAAVVAGELRFRLELDADRFDVATAWRFAASLETLLAGGLDAPERPLEELPLLREAERQQILEWGEGAPPPAADLTLHERIRRQAEAAPEAPAVFFEGQMALTWRELRRRTLGLARSLRAAGAFPGTVVGLSLDRSPELVVAVLATLETGAAYLPLDPGYPEDYLDYVVADSGVSIILRRDAPLPPPEPGEELAPLTGPPLPPEAWAYVLYTSGSAGKPKGTPVTHRALLNYLEWVLEEPLAGIDGLPFLTSLNFDASLKQLFAPLLRGRAVHLLGEESARRPERLLGLLHEDLRRGGRLALNCVPSLWRAALDLLEAGDLPAPPLTRLLLGGEGFDRDLVDRTLRLLPGVEIWNLYGPTEATANASAARLTAEGLSNGPLEDRRAPGIGRPIRGARLYVLDPWLQLVPPGAVGELAIGGAGVASGYWKRPDLTAERFVPDPFADRPGCGRGARLFRTGDLARWRPDGSLELLGRLDRQLKIRGLRIEPGEVEAVLATHPAVGECVVGTDPTASRLVAWVVPRSGATLTAVELRRHLEELLPASLVPAAFVLLGALPLLPNGKVSRAALPAPEAPVPRDAAAAPRSQAEEMLAWLWCEVLEVPQVGVHDDFFERGGHSLLATRLLARVRSVFGVELPLRSLFAAPTVARLAELIAAARRDRRERRDEVPPLEPVPRTGPLPLSFAQERLWFIDQWSPGNAAYNIPAAVRLRGALDRAALAASLAAVVRRHETLRTTFSAAGGRPVQIIHPSMPMQPMQDTPLPVVDLAGLPTVEEAWRELAVEEARRGFDLRSGPLMRTVLLRLAAADHVLVLNLHHIVSDGWSMGVLIEELRRLYADFHAGRPARLPALAVQYVDFAVWQRGLAEREGLARDLEWWRGALAGAPAALDLPADRPRPLWFIHRGAIEPVTLPAALIDRLHALARREDVTLFMVLLAAFELLLARLAGVDDLVVGTAVAQRTPEVEELIGLFVNLLALRGDLSGDPAFTGFLARTRSATLAAHDHQDVPFERLVAVLDPARDPGRHPLFQVALTLQNAPRPAALLPGLDLEISQIGTGTARFDLTLFLREKDGGLAGAMEHSADLFDRATVRRLLAAFESLLGGVVDDPGRPISQHSLLSPAERRQILESWSHGEDETPREATVPELFARQAALSPEAIALIEGTTEITYRELDRRSALLARRLCAAGAGPETPVAVFLERSIDMVVALLGILRAGAGYVPLDLGYPRERLAWMLEDSGSRLVVTRGGAAPPFAAGLEVVQVDGFPAEEAATPPEVAVRPDSLAYILYTSGSTGRPKGVAATHRGIARVVIDPGYVDLGPEDTILQLAPVPFDASTFEIWGALLNGGRLAVFPAGPVSLHDLAGALRRYRATTIFLTAGLFHQMIDEEPQGLAGLRQLIAGGDTVSVAHARLALERLPGCRLINGYGPTEATTFALCHSVVPADAQRPTLALGRPIARTSVWILDDRLEPVPPGVPGELYLGGDGLARGYWRRPGLTAERFVPHPFAAGPGERLYRTGDLARWQADGTVDFLGRIDRQVKVRGFRVEPAEIEATLERHPGIAAAVVGPRDDGRGNKRLVAWIVPVAPYAPGLSDGELLAWCRDHLPGFMVPGAFVLMDALPLDPNGKVDRRALPEPDRGVQSRFIAPRTPLEEQVAAVWAEVLGIDAVGVEDDFFELGGHSLLATQIVSRLARDFRIDLGLREFFDAPTVAGVAVAISREQAIQEDPEEVDRLLARVRGLSAEEIAKLLSEEGA